MYVGSISEYFDDEFDTNDDTLSKRNSNENKATFSIGGKYSQTEAQEVGNAKFYCLQLEVRSSTIICYLA